MLLKKQERLGRFLSGGTSGSGLLDDLVDWKLHDAGRTRVL